MRSGQLEHLDADPVGVLVEGDLHKLVHSEGLDEGRGPGRLEGGVGLIDVLDAPGDVAQRPFAARCERFAAAVSRQQPDPGIFLGFSFIIPTKNST